MTYKTLAEVATFIRGVTFDSSQQTCVSRENNIPILRAGNIGNELNIKDDLIFVPSNIVSKNQILQYGDIVMCLSSGSPKIVGKSAALKEHWRGSVGAFCGIVRPSNEIYPDYLAFWMRSSIFIDWRDEQARGANIQNLRFSELAKLEIRLPSTNKQQLIVENLTLQLAEVETARKALQIQENDVNKLEIQLLESIFTQSKPEKFLKISDVADTTSGSTPSRDNKEYWQAGQYAWVKTGEIVNKPIFKTQESISEKALKECSLTLLPPKTVLIAMYGQGKTRGQSAVLEIPATTNQACFAILPNEIFHAEYLQYWLRHSYSNLRLLSEGRGGNQSNFNGAMLKEFTVPFLPKDRQLDVVNSINAMLNEIEKVKASIQTNKTELSLLPNRLLAQAFNL